MKNLLFNKYFFLATVSLWVLFQIVWNSYFQYDEWIADSGHYQYYATECYKAGTMYPSYQFYHYEYIHNPGWVNILIIWYALFHSFWGAPYLLICLNLLCFFVLFNIAKQISDNPKVPFVVAYTYMLLPAFSTTFSYLWSEPAYILLALLSFLYSLKKDYFSIVLSGICLALAYWIRPVAVASTIAGVLFILFYHRSIGKLLVYLLSAVCVCCVIAIATHRNFPTYLCSATTGGTNLIMVANDNATGQWMGSIRGYDDSKGDKGIIPDLWNDNKYRPVLYSHWDTQRLVRDYSDKHTYKEVDSIYMSESIKWIMAHPWKYLKLMPQKLYYLYNGSATMIAPIYKGHMKLRAFVEDFQTKEVKLLILISLLGGLLFPIWRNKKILYLLSMILLYTSITIVSIVDPRFNWVILPYIILFFSVVIVKIMSHISRRSSLIFNEKQLS